MRKQEIGAPHEARMKVGKILMINRYCVKIERFRRILGEHKKNNNALGNA